MCVFFAHANLTFVRLCCAINHHISLATFGFASLQMMRDVSRSQATVRMSREVVGVGGTFLGGSFMVKFFEFFSSIPPSFVSFFSYILCLLNCFATRESAYSYISLHNMVIDYCHINHLYQFRLLRTFGC